MCYLKRLNYGCELFELRTTEDRIHVFYGMAARFAVYIHLLIISFVAVVLRFFLNSAVFNAVSLSFLLWEDTGTNLRERDNQHRKTSTDSIRRTSQ